MGIIRDFTDGNMQALRSLNSSVVGAVSPYVDNTTNALNAVTPPLPDAVTRRVDDLTRITKLLVDKPGIKFLGNQLLLSKAEIERKAKAAAEAKRDAGGTGAGQVISGLAAGVGAAAGIVLKVGASTLAQVPVNGTGTHFLRGFKTDTYLQPAQDPNNPDGGPGAFAQFFGAGGVEGAPLALEGSPIILDGGPQTGLSVFSIPNSSKEDAAKKISYTSQTNPKRLGLGDIYINGTNPIDSYLSSKYFATLAKPSNLLTTGSNELLNEEYTIPKLGRDFLGDTAAIKRKTPNTYFETPNPADGQNSDYLDTNYGTKQRQLLALTGGKLFGSLYNGTNVGQETFIPIAESRLLPRFENQSFASRFQLALPLVNFDTFEYLNISQASKTTLKDNALFTDVERTTNLLDFRELKGKGYRSNSYNLPYGSATINKTTRVGLGSPGKKRNKKVFYGKAYDEDTVDLINRLDVDTKPFEKGAYPTINGNGSRDLIQLEFQILTPDQTYYLPFRAFLTQFNDSFNASWNSTKYLGRADNFYTYTGFDRSISIGFKIAAQSRTEMKPLYRKAATLASVTAPTYGGGGRFMRGSIAKVTVGDYIYEQPGIIDSVQYSWQTDYPWEINMRGPEGAEGDPDLQILPHVLDVTLNFKVIHDFLPETGITPFITNHRKTQNPYIELVNREFTIPETRAEKREKAATEEAKRKKDCEDAEAEVEQQEQQDAQTTTTFLNVGTDVNSVDTTNTLEVSQKLDRLTGTGGFNKF